eukprot:280049_1
MIMNKESVALAKEYKNSLLKLAHSESFKSMQKKYGLHEYKIDVLSEKYRDDVIDILSEQFTYSGGNIIAVALNIVSGDANIKKWSSIVDHGIKYGLSMVILDKNNKVCYVSITEDMANEYKPTDKEMQNVSKKSMVVHDIFEQLSSKSEWYQENIKNKENKRIGHVIHVIAVATRKDLARNNIYKFAVAVSRAIFVGVKRIKYTYGEPAHLATIIASLKSQWFFNNILYKISKTNDNDGYYVMCGRLNVLNYFKDKFANDEWFRNNFNAQDVFQRLSK